MPRIRDSLWPNSWMEKGDAQNLRLSAFSSSSFTKSLPVSLRIRRVSVREAPSGQLQFFLKALLGIANKRKMNPSQYQQYSLNQALAQPSIQDLLYQKLVPGFVYTTNKLPGKLSRDTQKKAEKYFEGRFSRMQDGILILSGDLKEEEVKRLLLRYLGGFRTDKGTLPRRAVTGERFLLAFWGKLHYNSRRNGRQEETA